jgi:hypothetical protein
LSIGLRSFDNFALIFTSTSTIEWKNVSATLTKSGTIQVFDAVSGLSETLGVPQCHLAL